MYVTCYDRESFVNGVIIMFLHVELQQIPPFGCFRKSKIFNLGDLFCKLADMTRISLELSPHLEDGLVLYIGPLNYNPRLPVQDFMALELVKGLPVLLLDYGSGTIRIEHRHRFPQGKPFTVEIVLQPQMIEILHTILDSAQTLDNCKLSTCMSLDAPNGPNRFLNLNAPLQLGGAAVNLDYLGSLFNWTDVPQAKGFSDYVTNLNEYLYDLGVFNGSKNSSLFGQSSIFLGADTIIITIMVVFLVLIVLLIMYLALTEHKKDQGNLNRKNTYHTYEKICINQQNKGKEKAELELIQLPHIYQDISYVNDIEPNEHYAQESNSSDNFKHHVYETIDEEDDLPKPPQYDHPTSSLFNSQLHQTLVARS